MSLAPCPLVIHPNATIDNVLEWPTTVLATGPAPSMITNCDKLIAEAQSPLYHGEVSKLRATEKACHELTKRISIHRLIGTSDQTGNESMNGMK